MSSAPKGGGRGSIDPNNGGMMTHAVNGGIPYVTPVVAPQHAVGLPPHAHRNPSMSLPNGSITRETGMGVGAQYKVDFNGHPQARPPFQQFVQPPIYQQYPPQYQQVPYYNQQYGGPMMQQEPARSYPYAPNTMPAGQPYYQQQPAMNPSPAPAPPVKKERKLLVIANPDTGEAVEIDSGNRTRTSSENVEKKPVPDAVTSTDMDVKRTTLKKEMMQNIQSAMGAKESLQKKNVSQAQEKSAAEVTPVVAAAELPAVPEKTPVQEVEKAPVEEAPVVPATETVTQMEPAAVEADAVVPVAEETTVPETEQKEVPISESVSVPVIEQVPVTEEGTTVEEVSASEKATSPAQPSASTEETSAVSVEDSAEAVEEDPEVLAQKAEEEERERLAAEKERLVQREKELDELMATLLTQKEEVDVDACFFGRSFLYCVRDIEKEFKRTQCPLTPEQLCGFGIDISSMPKGNDAKKRHDFNPSWAQRPSMQGNRPNRPYNSRNSHNENRGRGGGGGGPNKKYGGSRMSYDRPAGAAKVTLGNKSENAWKPEKISPEDLEVEETRIKVLLKKVRSLMNKITPTTKEDLIKEFLEFRVSSSGAGVDSKDNKQLKEVIDVIFDKAVEEPKFCPLYSEVCKRQVEAELKENPKESQFRNGLLNRAQSTFVNKSQEEERAVKVAAVEAEEDPKKKRELQDELDQADFKFRRRKFGNITFIGQLYRQQLLSTRIANWCLYELIRHTHPVDNVPAEPPYDEESLHCAVQMLESLGKQLETAQDFNGKVYLDQTLDHLKQISSRCSNKIRFMIMGVIELRSNNWMQRKVVDQGPKKIDEIHKEIEREQMQQQQQRDSYDKRSGMRMGGGSLRRNNGPVPSRSSLDNRFNGGQMRSTKDRQAMAAVSSKLAPTSAPPRNLSLSQAGSGTTKKVWKSGASGGGANEGSAMTRSSTGGAWGGRNGSRDGSEARKLSHAEGKSSALAAASLIGGNTVKKTDSQLSINSQDAEPEQDQKKNEELLGKLKNNINSDLQEVASGDLPMSEMVEDLFKKVGMEKYGKPTVADIFQYLALSAVEKVSLGHLPLLGQVVCTAVQDTKQRADCFKGLAQFCEVAVDTEMWVDYPAVWTRLAEVIVNAVQCADAVEGAKPSYNDFGPCFIAAGKDPRKEKSHQLLLTVLERMVKYNASNIDDTEECMTACSMDYEELNFLSSLDKDRLDEALKSCQSDIKGAENLFTLLNH